MAPIFVGEIKNPVVCGRKSVNSGVNIQSLYSQKTCDRNKDGR